MELVSGWSDDNYVYLVERASSGTDAVRVRRMAAKWSAFFVGLNEDDRLALARCREVTAISVRGVHTRVDFRSRWDRRKLCDRVSLAIEGARAAGDYTSAILEADVNPLRRLLSDHGALEVSTRPRLAWFDLETDSRVRFSDAIEGKARILCWALSVLTGGPGGQASVVASGLLEADTDEAERALIESFFAAVRDYDVLMAWSGDGFDFPVLEARAHAVRARPGGLPPLWNRWCWLDCMETFKKYHAHVHESGEEKTSFKLNSIAQAVLGHGKRDFEASRTWEAWVAGGEQRQNLLDYNKVDTLLMPEIEHKTGYVALHIAVCSVTRCFPDSRSLMASQQGDGFLLRLGEIHGHRWPTKTYSEGDQPQQYAGAFVMEPTRTGIIEDVHVADFASLYPAIIRSWNISPETALYKLDPEPPAGTCRLPYSDHVRFSRAGRGMFPRALDELVARRAEYSRKADEAEPGSEDWEHYRRLSGAYKIVANSFYGIMGSPYIRFFSSTAAEAVTQTGAWLIKRVAAASKDAGLEAFYSDTDSVFVSGDSDCFAAVVAGLNKSWSSLLLKGFGCVQCHIKLEFEKSYSRLVLVSAKRYLGRYSVYKGKPVVDKIEVKGLEYKRGDTMRMARVMQKALIDLLLAPTVPTVEQALAFVAGWKARVLSGVLTVEDIVLSQSVKGLDEYVDRFTSLKCANAAKSKKSCMHAFASTDIKDVRGKPMPSVCPRCGAERKRLSPPVHVRVAKILQARGEEIRSGTRVEYLITNDEGDRIEAVPARDEDAISLIYRDYYWTTRIYPASARVLERAFPAQSWTESAAQTKARRKAAAIASKRGVTSDLPLFSRMLASNDHDPLVITLDAELDAGVDLRVLKNAVCKHAGSRLAQLRMVSDIGSAVIELGHVADDPDTIAELEKITGVGTVSVSGRRVAG